MIVQTLIQPVSFSKWLPYKKWLLVRYPPEISFVGVHQNRRIVNLQRVKEVLVQALVVKGDGESRGNGNDDPPVVHLHVEVSEAGQSAVGNIRVRPKRNRRGLLVSQIFIPLKKLVIIVRIFWTVLDRNRRWLYLILIKCHPPKFLTSFPCTKFTIQVIEVLTKHSRFPVVLLPRLEVLLVPESNFSAAEWTHRWRLWWTVLVPTLKKSW